MAKGFVVLSIGNLKSNHVGAQSTLKVSSRFMVNNTCKNARVGWVCRYSLGGEKRKQLKHCLIR